MKHLFVAVLAASLTVAVAAQTQTTSQTDAKASQQTTGTVGKTAGATTATDSAVQQTTQTTTRGADAKTTSNTAANAATETAGGVTLPPGTRIPAVLSKSIDSKKAKAGDKVEAKTAADILSQGKVVIPRNSKLIGHITEAQAKGSGASESKLGIVFDQIVPRKGEAMPLNANIQAIGAAVVNHAASVGADQPFEGSGGAYGGGSAGAAPAGGGVLGGATSTVGSAVGGAAGTVGSVGDTAGSAVGGVGSTVGSTVGSATQGTVGAAGNTVGVTGALNSSSTGVVGLKDLQLSSSNNAQGGASVVTSSGKSVKLDSGSQLVLNVTGAPAAPNQ